MEKELDMKMEKIETHAYAKINLTLDILNKREDNYHNIKSIFQKISLYDDLTIIKTNTDNIELETNVENINNNDNIVCKAYRRLKEKFPFITGIKVILEKRIPMQAGLGGGSTDCASFLKAMNSLFELNLSLKELKEIGKSLGADVVPCLYDGALLAEGIGEIITPIDTNFKYNLLIIKPEFSNNTKEMYQLIDNENLIRTSNDDKTDNVLYALLKNDITMLSNNLYNVFEMVSENKEIIDSFKSILKNNGAIDSLMTGSGSCIYGIFENKEKAIEAYNNLKDSYQVYLCEAQN